jgi:hypothetical protein
MVRQHDNPGHLLPQDVMNDATDQPGIAHPYSQNEIDDLLYGSDRSVEERVERLREIRDEMAMRETGDFGGGDPQSLVDELDGAIAALTGDLDDAEAYPDITGAVSSDPADHLDALSPDDIEARDALIGEEELYGDEEAPVDDDHAWSGSEELRPNI